MCRMMFATDMSSRRAGGPVLYVQGTVAVGLTKGMFHTAITPTTGSRAQRNEDICIHQYGQMQSIDRIFAPCSRTQNSMLGFCPVCVSQIRLGHVRILDVAAQSLGGSDSCLHMHETADNSHLRFIY